MKGWQTCWRWPAVILIGVAAAAGQFLVAAPATGATATAAAKATPISWLAACDSANFSGEGLPHSTGNCARAYDGSGSATWAQEAYQDLHGPEPRLQRPDLVGTARAPSPPISSTRKTGWAHPNGSRRWAGSTG